MRGSLKSSGWDVFLVFQVESLYAFCSQIIYIFVCRSVKVG